MVKSGIPKIMADNGFRSHPHPNKDCGTYIVENIGFVEMNQQITYIDVGRMGVEFTIFINFKGGVVNTSNLNIDLDMYVRLWDGEGNEMLKCEFNNKNDLIEELHKLNCVGMNIKG